MKKKTVKLKNIVIGEGRPKICVPVTGRTGEEILSRGREAAAARPDLAEWRADFWDEITDPRKAVPVLEKLSGILKDIPLLFTFRSLSEGGEREISAEDYRTLNLRAAARPEISVVDVEVLNPAWDGPELVRQIRAAGKPVIGSRHFFDRTPENEELDEIFNALAASEADILKLAVMPGCPEDVLRLMGRTLREHEQRPQPVVTMSMGMLGAVSRVSGRLTGSAVTFGTAGEASAPGQLPAGELEKILDLLA